MSKEFNITGTCIPEMHYMVDMSHKLEEVVNLIEKQKYFIINRPRQYGKTTTLFLLNKRLKNTEDYLPIKISFEGIGDTIFENEELFSKGFLQLLEKNLRINYISMVDIFKILELEEPKVRSLNDLSAIISKLVQVSNKKIVLMIDEVDKSSNSQLFLSFLGMLRNKYLLRNEGEDYTFHSVILAGVHDVKSLKSKIRKDEEQKYNSPWNIAADFNIDMSFSEEEIETMLVDYVNSTGVVVDKKYYSKKLRYYTSGYPFLVSKLCKIIDEKLMDKNELLWKNEYMDMAVKELLKESNTNFDSLIKNIENNRELNELVKKIILDGSVVNFNIYNPDINIGMLYGFFKNNNGELAINNRVYEQLIYEYFSSIIQTSYDFQDYNNKSNYLMNDGGLDIKKIIMKFQEFMKHEYSEKRQPFLEEDGRLLFLAFLSPIINGVGFAFKEVRGGNEKRFDIVITYNKKLYILELKIWRGEEYHKKGLVQLGEYLEQYNLEDGYLLIFDFRKETGMFGNIEETFVTIGQKEKRITEGFC